MKRSLYKYILAATLVLVPAVTFAATNGTLKTLISTIISYLNMALVLMMAVAIVVFTAYVIKYFVMHNENRSEGNMYIMYSVIGFFVILSFWGLVNILQNSFGLGNSDNKPGDWASFTNIFPGGSSSGGSNNAADNGFGTGCNSSSPSYDPGTGLCL